jgi:hypothetical protein
LKGDFTGFPSMPKVEIVGKLVFIDVNHGKKYAEECMRGKIRSREILLQK